ncbi:MAG: transposase [Polaromonas sp.]
MTDPDSAKMATSKGVIQGYAAQAAVDSAHQIIIAADVIGSGSEQAMLLPMIEQAAPYRTADTLVTADAGYHSDANVGQLMQQNIPAMIADNQMRSRDERFQEQDKYKGKPDPLSEKKATGQPKAIERFQPKDFSFNDDDTATCPAGKLLTSTGTLYLTAIGLPYQRYTAKAADCQACARTDQCLKAHSNPTMVVEDRSHGSSPKPKTRTVPWNACVKRLTPPGAGSSTASALAPWSRCLATSGTTSA